MPTWKSGGDIEFAYQPNCQSHISPNHNETCIYIMTLYRCHIRDCTRRIVQCYTVVHFVTIFRWSACSRKLTSLVDLSPQLTFCFNNEWVRTQLRTQLWKYTCSCYLLVPHLLQWLSWIPLIGQPSVKLNHLILQHHVIYVNIGARSCLLCVVIQFAPVLVKGRKSGFLS